MKRPLLIAALLVAGVCSTVSAAAEVGVSDTRILIGGSVSVTGPVAAVSNQEVAGFEAYLEFVNAQGGVNGRKFESKWYDDAFKPQEAVANMKRLVEQDGVFITVLSQGTPPTKAPIPYLEEKKVPLLFPWQGDPDLAGKKYVFTGWPFYDQQTRIMTKWLVEAKGLKRIGIIYQDDAFGQEFNEGLRRELKGFGLEVAAAEPVRRGSTDAAPQVAKLATADLDACLLALTPGQGAQVLKEAAKAGWSKTKLVAVGPLTDELFLALAPVQSDGVWGFSPWPDPTNSQLPAVKKFREVLAQYRPKQAPSRYNLFGYLYAMVTVEGIKRAGKNLTREGLIRGLESIKDWDTGIVPPISFSPTNHHAQFEGMMVEAKGGRFHPVTGWLNVRAGKLVQTPLKE